MNRFIAQNLINCPDGTQADPTIGCVTAPGNLANSEASLVDLVVKLSNGLSSVVIALSIIFMIKGAIQYSLASGDDEKIQKAKKTLIWSSIGLVLALSAKIIASTVIGLT